MRRVERIIDRIRRETENEEVNATIGISDEEMLDYLNDAQDRVYAEVVKTHPKFYLKELRESIPANQESYALPSKIYLGQITLVEFSHTNRNEDFYRLRQAMMPERLSYPVGYPTYYIRRNNELLFVPTPGLSGGVIRLTYVERIPRLDKRRARVGAFTTSGQELTSLTLATGELIDRDNLILENAMCVVDKDGNLIMENIRFTDIDAATGVVALDGTHVFSSTESITTDSYVVMGSYTTNKSLLQDITERYLASHLKFEVFDRDSAVALASSQKQKLDEMLAEIVASFADVSDDILEPPILDPSYIIDDVFF